MQTLIFVNNQIQLTPFRQEDKPLLLRYLNDSVIFENTSSIPSPYTERDAEEWLEKVVQRREKHGTEANWAIRHQSNGLMGSIGRFLKSGVNGHLDEIGYWLAAPFRGRGVMSEVVQVYCQWLFDNHPELVRIEASAYPHNPASIRVLQKAGFEQEGYFKKKHLKNGRFIDSVFLAKLREETIP